MSDVRLRGYVAHNSRDEYVEGYGEAGDAGRAVMRVLGKVEEVLDRILSLAGAPPVLAAG